MTAYNLRKRSNRFKREDDNDTEFEDQPEYVLSCYREGKQCCDSFEELCHGNSDCGQSEICCFANCTVQCFPVEKLGKIPDRGFLRTKNAFKFNHILIEFNFYSFRRSE